VNNYAGVFTATADGKIMIQPLAATQMLGPPELTALDTTYLDALSRVREIRMRSEEITLEAEAISMVFAARNASEASFGVAPGNTGR
jgi:heat shock protein HslJ